MKRVTPLDRHLAQYGPRMMAAAQRTVDEIEHYIERLPAQREARGIGPLTAAERRSIRRTMLWHAMQRLVRDIVSLERPELVEPSLDAASCDAANEEVETIRHGFDDVEAQEVDS